jgi:general transcription factor 3C polypeptide 5 (transcription factor C subunit 1)
LDVAVPDKELLSVAYPGYVRNISRVMATLGGKDSIESAFNTPQSMLELRFRPGNADAHALRAARSQTKGIVLKIKRSVRKDPETGEEEVAVSVEALGIVRSTFNFQGHLVRMLSLARLMRFPVPSISRVPEYFRTCTGLCPRE